VRISNFNRNHARTLFVLVAAVLLTAHFTTPIVCAVDKTDNGVVKTEDKNEKIHITAEKLISDTDAKFVEFIGNVKASQGDTVITSDRLKISYKKDLEYKKNQVVGEESIEKVVAKGNVKIIFAKMVAVTQHAEYITKSRVLVLSGDNSRITKGNDSVSGEKITLFRADGRIIVEGRNEKQVEAVIFSGEMGIK